MRHYLEAIATLTGAVIGAGVLGIPYVIAKAGFLTGLITLASLGLIVMLMFLYLGEIVLRTKGDHQLTGYCEKYLGKWGKAVMAVSMVLGIYGALIAYFIGEGQALSAIFGGNPVYYYIGFFVFVAMILFFGLKAVEESDLLFGVIVLSIILLIIGVSIWHVDIANLNSFSIKRVFIPYGVVLFAYLGMVAIPEMKEELKGNLKCMKRAIIIGAAIPIIVYTLFSLVVVGAIGLDKFEMMEPDQRIATIALGTVVGKSMFIMGNLFAVFAMLTSFITLGLALKEMYVFDYKINKNIAWGLTCVIPFVIGLSKLTNFIEIIGLTGVVAGGIDAVLIILMTMKAKKLGDRKPEYTIKINWMIAILLMSVFVAGAIFYFVNKIY